MDILGFVRDNGIICLLGFLVVFLVVLVVTQKNAQKTVNDNYQNYLNGLLDIQKITNATLERIAAALEEKNRK